jgi:hypothetical protein
MEHPFSVRSWQRQDFAAMSRLLHLLGFNAVMIWPTPETAPGETSLFKKLTYLIVSSTDMLNPPR